MIGSYWRKRAEQVIDDTLEEAAAAGLDFAATVRLVNARYPFGERAHWPYKVWLNVRQSRLFGNVQPIDNRARQHRRQEAAAAPHPGQSRFFDLCAGDA